MSNRQIFSDQRNHFSHQANQPNSTQRNPTKITFLSSLRRWLLPTSISDICPRQCLWRKILSCTCTFWWKYCTFCVEKNRAKIVFCGEKWQISCGGGGYCLRSAGAKLISDEPQMPNTVGGALGAHREMTSLKLKTKSITFQKYKSGRKEKWKSVMNLQG